MLTLPIWPCHNKPNQETVCLMTRKVNRFAEPYVHTTKLAIKCSLRHAWKVTSIQIWQVQSLASQLSRYPNRNMTQHLVVSIVRHKQICWTSPANKAFYVHREADGAYDLYLGLKCMPASGMYQTTSLITGSMGNVLMLTRTRQASAAALRITPAHATQHTRAT